MLVLTRKMQEKIQIGQDITVTILRVKGNVVRVGIEAPRNVRVLRAELPTFEALDVAAAPASNEATNAEVHESVALFVELSAAESATKTVTAEGVGEGPSVGRRFVIRQQPGRFGRRQISAVAAP